jgi:hypothetical protein
MDARTHRQCAAERLPTLDSKLHFRQREARVSAPVRLLELAPDPALLFPELSPWLQL